MFNKKAIKFFKQVAIIFTCGLAFVAHSQEAIEPDAKALKFWNDFEPDSIMQVNHDQWQGLLTKYLDDQHASGINRFDYASVSSDDRQTLKGYLDYLQLLEPRQLNEQEAKAYWLNLYNAALVDDIVDAYQSDPIDSVRELRSGAFRSWPWTRNAVEVLLQKLSLSDIEHNIIRPVFKDPRVHYALAKGSLGGGSLLKTAFNGDNNEALLIQAEKDYLSHPRGVQFGPDASTATLSSIFEWYAADFANNQDELIAYLSEHVSEDAQASLLLVEQLQYDYDWSLNSQ